MFNKKLVHDLQREVEWLRNDHRIMRQEFMTLSRHLYTLAENLGYQIDFIPQQEVWGKIEKE